MYSSRLTMFTLMCASATSLAEFRMPETTSEIMCSVSGVSSIAMVALLFCLVRGMTAHQVAMREQLVETTEEMKVMRQKGVGTKPSLTKQLATIGVLALPCAAVIYCADGTLQKTCRDESKKIACDSIKKVIGQVITTIVGSYILSGLR